MMNFIFTRLAIFCFCFLVFSSLSQAQLLAFPTAEGAGKFVTGGRGTIASPPKILEVTTLIDDAASATTPGTFRYACTFNSPAIPNRIIVFRVSGTIHLYAPLILNRANTTIAGQTAPGEGICIADYPVTINANNMIIRYLRFRLGDKNQNKGMVNGSGADDAFGDNGNGRQKIIIDHCTASWSNDEAFTLYKGDSVTVQWCMITEPLNYSYHFETGDSDFEQHAYGGIWGGRHASFHHNLFAHLKGRTPRFDGIRNISADTGDFRNNVIYNWIDYNVNGGEGGTYNVVNNYYKYGPSTLNSSTAGVHRRSMLINPYKSSSPAIPYGRYYLTGNYSDNSVAVTNSNWLGAAFSGGTLNDSVNSKVTTPFNVIPVNTQSAQEAYNAVLANAGCFLPHRDTLDQRIVNDVINRTGKIIDVQGGYPHGTPYATSQTAWPTLASGTAPVDSDNDGMPDVWETLRGLNPNSLADANGYSSTSGYPNIENYINGDTIVAKGIAETCVTVKSMLATSSGRWVNAADSIHSSYLSPNYLSSTDSMNVVASVLDNGNFGDFAVSYYTTNTIRYDTYNHPYLNRNITITPASPGNIISPVTVRLYFTKAEYDALKAADNSISTLNDLRIIKVPSNTCLTSLTGNVTVINPSAAGVYGTYANGYYLEFTTSSFSTFFITSAISSATLPLNLLSFEGALENSKVKLSWRTTNETKVERYAIERSIDGIGFTTIGSVAAVNSLALNNYTYTDASPIKGKSFYRLKMLDRDSKFTYSKIVTFSFSKDVLTLAPNPVANTLTITHPKSKPGEVIQIFSAGGSTVLKQTIATGVTQTIINVSPLAAGMYQLIIINNKSTASANFLKQ